MEKKITKAMRYEDIIAILNGETPVNGTTIDEAVAFMVKEQEQNAKKNQGKSKAQQELAVENEKRKLIVLEVLRNSPDRLFTVAELVKELITVEDMTSSRITYLLGCLVKEDKVEKSTEKRKSVYKFKTC